MSGGAKLWSGVTITRPVWPGRHGRPSSSRISRRDLGLDVIPLARRALQGEVPGLDGAVHVGDAHAEHLAAEASLTSCPTTSPIVRTSRRRGRRRPVARKWLASPIRLDGRVSR